MLDDKILRGDDLEATMKHTLNCVQLDLHDRLDEMLPVINNKIGEERLKFN